MLKWLLLKHFHSAPAVVATRRHPVWQKGSLWPQVKLQMQKGKWFCKIKGAGMSREQKYSLIPYTSMARLKRVSTFGFGMI